MILCVGLTPTVQRTQRFTDFALGAVNRARETIVTASGKAVNVARVITLLGEEAKLVHVLGGETGAMLSARLEIEGIASHFIWAEDDAPTRTCATLLTDGGVVTELVEEAKPVSPHDVALVSAAAKTALLEAKALCCSGSLPPGAPETFYADLVREARTLNIPAIVDAQKGPLRATLAEHPFLVKPNRDEAMATLGLSATGDSLKDARTAARALVDAGAQWALVSMGKAGSILTDGKAFWQILPPAVEAVNPIGSGDSLTAGLVIAHVLYDKTVPEAAAYGTACAAANCLTATSGVLRPEDVGELYPKVEVREIASTDP